MKLNSLIHKLIEMERKLGDVEVYICVEPEIKKQSLFGFTKVEEMQFEDKLTDMSHDGKRVILLGESFD